MFLINETSVKVGGTSFIESIGRDTVLTEGVPFEMMDGTEDVEKTKAYKDLSKDKRGSKRDARTAGIVRELSSTLR